MSFHAGVLRTDKHPIQCAKIVRATDPSVGGFHRKHLVSLDNVFAFACRLGRYAPTPICVPKFKNQIIFGFEQRETPTDTGGREKGAREKGRPAPKWGAHAAAAKGATK